MKTKISAFILACVFSLPLLADDYPGRKIYPSVSVYETEQLNQSYNDVIIVDVRSPYEYDTLHINSAVNIPLSTKKFAQQVEAARKDDKPIVFYCNGHTCYKSYKAVIKAHNAGLEEVFAYDSGIFDWASAHPDKATLVGITPIDKQRLISKEKFNKHLLEPEKFIARVKQNVAILDIREPSQRGLLELFPYRQDNVSLEQKKRLVEYLDKIYKSGKTLLVYDEAGKQVRWLQYYLEAKGIRKYYFMQGGVKNYFKSAGI